MTRCWTVLVALALAGSSIPAHADNEPWKKGVTPDQMARAKVLLDAGNALLLEHEYSQALAKYEEAVAVWDHPAIRFNMVRCQIQLGRILDASDNLERALKYGAAPLEETVYNEALSYQKLLANQISQVTVECKQAGVELTFDGQPLLHCPGTITQRVLPGRHQLVGKGTGLLTKSTDVFITGGQPEHAAIELQANTARNATIEHRWGAWLPWTVFASGFVIAGAGGVLELTATSTRDEYYQRIAHDCASMPCDAAYLDSIRNRAFTENHAAIAAVSIGAATVVTGAVMLYLNRGRTVYSSETVTAGIAPAQHGVAFTVLGRF